MDSCANNNLPYMEDLIIDFFRLTSQSPVVATDELKKLRNALSSWGCFQLINHGMSVEFLDEVRDVGKQFFALSEEEKQKYLRRGESLEGYGNDSITSSNVPLKWQHRLFLTTYPLENRNYDRWPKTPKSFREILHEYNKNMKSIHDILLEKMALCLNLKENCFMDEYGGGIEIVSRYQFYLPCNLVDQIRVSSKHADSSSLTFLLQDKDVEGLEVEKDDKWFKAPVFPHAIFVNIGDQMEIISNGKFKSAIHRVVPHHAKTRISLPLFCGPPQHKEIGPIKELVTEDQPAIYRRINNYRQIFFRYHPTGVPPISTVKIIQK